MAVSKCPYEDALLGALWDKLGHLTRTDKEQRVKKRLNLVVIGSGRKCTDLLDRFEKRVFESIRARIVAIVDTGEEASAVAQAEDRGVFVTRDLRKVLQRKDVDLIINLADDKGISKMVLQEKGKQVVFLDDGAAQLLGELVVAEGLLDRTRGELARMTTLYEAVINAFFHEDVMLIGRDYGILDINDTLLKKMGLTRASALGLHCYELSHDRDKPCDGKEHPCPLMECLGTGRASQATHVHRDKEDNPRYYSISCYPIFSNHAVQGVIEISKDITKDILLQRRLVEQQKLASVGQLAAGVAHEINNPLTTILTTALLIQEETDREDPNYNELETIANETLRCRKIVTSLLDFARQSKPAKAFHDINQVVRDSMALTRKQAAFKDVTFEAVLSEPLPLVEIDKDQIQQCLINLAINAIEATDPGGKIRFASRLVPEKEGVEITVSDTGGGIPKNALDRIFEPFFTSKEGGTGLGLAITHGILEQHDGTIDLESKEGEGTTFRIHLPLRRGERDA
jgi:two-component system, NtrC family, sensor kinase